MSHEARAGCILIIMSPFLFGMIGYLIWVSWGHHFLTGLASTVILLGTLIICAEALYTKRGD